MSTFRGDYRDCSTPCVGCPIEGLGEETQAVVRAMASMFDESVVNTLPLADKEGMVHTAEVLADAMGAPLGHSAKIADAVTRLAVSPYDYDMKPCPNTVRHRGA